MCEPTRKFWFGFSTCQSTVGEPPAPANGHRENNTRDVCGEGMARGEETREARRQTRKEIYAKGGPS